MWVTPALTQILYVQHISMYKEMEPCIVERVFLQEQCPDIQIKLICDAKSKNKFYGATWDAQPAHTQAILLFLTVSSGNCRAMQHSREAQMCT